MAGRTPHDLFPPALADQIVERYRACCEARQPIQYEETLDLPAGTVHAALTEDEAGPLLLLDGVSRRLRVVRRGAELTVILAGRNHVLVQEDPLAPPRTETAGGDRVTREPSVLEANDGDLGRSIEALLEMTGGAPPDEPLAHHHAQVSPPA